MTESRGINYSGIDIFSNKIICADCGSAFGRKVWHSNDKYRRVVYRCNNKFKSDRVGKSGKSDNIMSTSTEKCHSIISEEKCHSMTVDEEIIKNVFVEKYNQINRKEYLKNAENIIKTLDKKDENIDILREKIENIVVKINYLVDRNATVKMDQDEYRNKHEKLVKIYEKLKVELENKENEQKSREDRVKEIRIYIDTLKKSSINKEFNSELFAILVDKVIVSESEIKIRWKDGRET